MQFFLYRYLIVYLNNSFISTVKMQINNSIQAKEELVFFFNKVKFFYHSAVGNTSFLLSYTAMTSTCRTSLTSIVKKDSSENLLLSSIIFGCVMSVEWFSDTVTNMKLANWKKNRSYGCLKPFRGILEDVNDTVKDEHRFKIKQARSTNYRDN